MKVTVIDYGLSNLLSVRHAFAHFGAETLLTSDPADVLAAEKLVLPGVGAFKDGMDGLARLGLIEPIRQKAAAGTPLLGICLGMQMLFEASEEKGLHQGFGWIKGNVVKIQETALSIPEIGWNALVYTKEKVEAKRVVGGDGFVKWLMDNLPEETRLTDMIRIASIMESLARRSEESGGLGILLKQVVAEAKAKKAAELDEDKLVKEHMDKCSDHEHIRTKENFGTEEFEVDICLELVRKALDGDIDSLQTFASPAALVALLRCFYTVHANKGHTKH